MKKIFPFVFLLFSITQVTYGQNLDSIVHQAIKSSGTIQSNNTGVAVAVTWKGRDHFYYFGNTKQEKGIYEIGSITKTFTSMLLVQAVVDKKLSLNDDIRKYLKGNYENLQYQGKPVRLVHLANFTSGLPDNLSEKQPEPLSVTTGAQPVTFKTNAYRQRLLAELHQFKLNREPGLIPAHSNVAAQLLGLILENVYDLSYEDLLKKYITGPLKMHSTFLKQPVNLKPYNVPGYNAEGKQVPEIPEEVGSSGALRSTLPDMVKYLRFQLDEKDKRVLLAHEVYWGKLNESANGLSWWLKTNFDDQKKIWASGGTYGFSSYSVVYPGRNFGVVALCNRSDNTTQSILDDVAQKIYNELFFSPEQRAVPGFGFSKSVGSLLGKVKDMGLERIIEASDLLKAKDPSFLLSEDELNEYGYYVLRKGDKAQALAIFKLNVYLYPASANTYDSLAEAYEAVGDKPLAIKNYKKSFELNPSNTNAASRLKVLAD